MRIDETDREFAKREREFVVSFTSKQKREPGKTLSDVNMATCQPGYSYVFNLMLSLVPEDNAVLCYPFFFYQSPLTAKLSRSAKRYKTLANSHEKFEQIQI